MTLRCVKRGLQIFLEPPLPQSEPGARAWGLPGVEEPLGEKDRDQEEE